jgi:hypothetical protein
MATLKPRQVETFQRAIHRLNCNGVTAFNRGDVVACAGFYAAAAPPGNGPLHSINRAE